jgi:hypothetical protein
MYGKPLIGNELVRNRQKGAGKTALCVEVSEQFPFSQGRREYPAGFYVKGWIERPLVPRGDKRGVANGTNSGLRKCGS